MWKNLSINRLKELTIDKISKNTIKPSTGLQGKPAGLLSPSRAEELDFLSINEWIKVPDDGRLIGYDT